MSLPAIAKQINEATESIFLIYAFNATGKTRLSVEYKNLTKDKEGRHAGVYYNAFSEDLFVWDNDNVKLNIIPSSLNKFHSLITEDSIKEKLIPYDPSYNFYFNAIKDSSDYESITFFKEGEEDTPIKISRGEERIFVWCFFLALFEVEGWADVQKAHFFIDDPVSSLDDHNVFVTAALILDLIGKHCDDRKIIITTHHFGIFSILMDWLGKGENATKFKKKVEVEEASIDGDTKVITKKEKEVNKFKICFLEKDNANLKLTGKNKGTLLYHLVLLQMLNEAVRKDELFIYHFVILRQVLESVSSFLGSGRFGYTLNKINVTDNRTSDVLNAMSHQKIYSSRLSGMSRTEKETFLDVWEKLKSTIPFDLD